MSGIRTPLEFVARNLRRDSIAFDANLALWFQKYFDGDHDDQTPEGKTARSRFVGHVASRPMSPLYPKYFERWKNSLNDGQTSFYRVSTTSRVAIGLGNASVIESGCTLHHTYGVPYWPGSALKGVAARFARVRLGAQKPEWRRDRPYYEQLFGSHDVGGDVRPEDAMCGCVDFLDALPVLAAGENRQGIKVQLMPDVVTVHHPEYYNGGNAPTAPPTDWDSPVPNSFLSFSGTFLIALRGPGAWCQTAAEILFQALQDDGIGAKTSSGYGRAQYKPYQGEERAARRRATDDREIEAENTEPPIPIVQLERAEETAMILSIEQNPRVVLVEAERAGEHVCLDVPDECGEEDFIQVEIARDENGAVVQVRFLERL